MSIAQKALRKTRVKVIFLLIFTHAFVALFGFALGIYSLPILTAPDAPTNIEVADKASQAIFKTKFVRELKDSDVLHWGDGEVTLGADYITLTGELAPGPDYKLYLSPEFVETEARFNQLKSTMKQVGSVNTFNNFVVTLTDGTDVSSFNTVIVWCESFGEFITSAQYQ